MNAKEAKERALANKEKIEDIKTKRTDSAFQTEVKLLHTHFMTEVERAVKKGHLYTQDITFPSERFSDEIIREVAQILRDDGFHLNMDKHNAYKTTKFSITWSG